MLSELCAHMAGTRSSTHLHPLPPGRRERPVLLTREAHKNQELADLLQARGVPVLQVPLVKATQGPDRCALTACPTGRPCPCSR